MTFYRLLCNWRHTNTKYLIEICYGFKNLWKIPIEFTDPQNFQKAHLFSADCGGVQGADFETAIAATGYGKFHYILLLVLFLPCWASIFDVSNVSMILPSAECDLGLSLFHKGVLNAVTYAGEYWPERQMYFIYLLSCIISRVFLSTILLCTHARNLGTRTPSGLISKIFRYSRVWNMHIDIAAITATTAICINSLGTVRNLIWTDQTVIPISQGDQLWHVISYLQRVSLTVLASVQGMWKGVKESFFFRNPSLYILFSAR